MTDDEPPHPLQVEIVERRRLIDDVFRLDAVRYRVERYRGGFGAMTRRLVLERGDSVAALLVDGEAAWLIEQLRIAAHGQGSGWLLELAAGIVDSDESPERALRREVKLRDAKTAIAALHWLGETR